MSIIQDKHYTFIKNFIDRNKFTLEEKSEPTNKRIDVKSGKFTATVKVYETGTIQIQGAQSGLKDCLTKVKEALEKGETVGEMLPFEIERFPEVLNENIPNIDPVIVRFIEEAIITVKAGSNLGCAFLLGGASEKAILILIGAYADAIEDETHKEKFKQRIANKFISKVFDEFKQSYKGSQNKPTEFGWTNDIEVKIEQIFQFCRICRNEAGHPHLPPNLDKGVLLANMGQFVKYIEDVYHMIDYYKTNKVKL